MKTDALKNTSIIGNWHEGERYTWQYYIETRERWNIRSACAGGSERTVDSLGEAFEVLLALHIDLARAAGLEIYQW